MSWSTHARATAEFGVVLPGAVAESRQMILQLFRVRLRDAGSNGVPGDSDDRDFAMQGIYVP